MNKIILITAAVFGLLSVAIGAFAAHGLETLISAEAISTFQIGVRYQMYYAILLLFVGSSNILSGKTKKTVFYLTIIGVVFFSGSIYALATNVLTLFDFKTIGFITPIGGFLLIMVWLVLLINFIKLKTDN